MTIKSAVDEALENLGSGARPIQIINYIHEFIDQTMKESSIRINLRYRKVGYPSKN